MHDVLKSQSYFTVSINLPAINTLQQYDFSHNFNYVFITSYIEEWTFSQKGENSYYFPKFVLKKIKWSKSSSRKA